MKRTTNLAVAVLALAAFGLPVFAQDYSAPLDGKAAAAPDKPAEKPAAKKPAGKKPAKKKKPAAPASEYKFSAAEKAPVYKFDKHANPIVKAPKKKPAPKTGKKPAGAKAPSTPAAKLKPAKHIGEEEAPAQNPQNPQEGN